MANLLDNYTKQARSNNIKPMTKKSREWFMDLLLSGELSSSWKRLKRDKSTKTRSAPMIGKMYTFSYKAKHRKTLPYYDRYPLIIMADLPKQGPGFYGLNLHYLRPSARAALLSKLFNAYSTGSTITENTRLKISYDILSSAGRMRAFKPTFKRYLPKHIKSTLVEIPPEHWETAIWLPTQRFVGASTSQVWADSKG